MNKSSDSVVEAVKSLRAVDPSDLKDLMRRLEEIDPDFFDALRGALRHPQSGQPIVPNGVMAKAKPGHESGSLT